MREEPNGVWCGKKRAAYRDSPDLCPSVILIGSLLIRKYISSFFGVQGDFIRGGFLPVVISHQG
jgi:hypothetical protein